MKRYSVTINLKLFNVVAYFCATKKKWLVDEDFHQRPFSPLGSTIPILRPKEREKILEYADFYKGNSALEVVQCYGFVIKATAPYAVATSWFPKAHDQTEYIKGEKESWLRNLFNNSPGSVCCDIFGCANGYKIDEDEVRFKSGLENALKEVLSVLRNKPNANEDPIFKVLRKIPFIVCSEDAILKQILAQIAQLRRSLKQITNEAKSLTTGSKKSLSELLLNLTKKREEVLEQCSRLTSNAITNKESLSQEYLDCSSDLEVHLDYLRAMLLTRFPKHYFDSFYQDFFLPKHNSPFHQMEIPHGIETSTHSN